MNKKKQLDKFKSNRRGTKQCTTHFSKYQTDKKGTSIARDTNVKVKQKKQETERKILTQQTVKKGHNVRQIVIKSQILCKKKQQQTNTT